MVNVRGCLAGDIQFLRPDLIADFSTFFGSDNDDANQRD
jgi:hypothetical protein